MSKNILEVELTTDNSSNPFFRPLNRALRGTIDVKNWKDKEASSLYAHWSEPIPGKHIGIDLDSKVAYVDDPLRDDKYEALREKIKRAGFGIGLKREEFRKVHLPTWLYWLKRTVESGQAKVVIGELPEAIEGEPKLEFITRTGKPTEVLMAEALDGIKTLVTQQGEFMKAMCETLAKLAAKK